MTDMRQIKLSFKSLVTFIITALIVLFEPDDCLSFMMPTVGLALPPFFFFSDYGSPANLQVALFDASIPGTLPILNPHCVDAAVRTALALNCQVSSSRKFVEKSKENM